MIDEYGTEWGYCNSCGEEAEMDSECCDDGEVVAENDMGSVAIDVVLGDL